MEKKYKQIVQNILECHCRLYICKTLSLFKQILIIFIFEFLLFLLLHIVIKRLFSQIIFNVIILRKCKQ